MLLNTVILAVALTPGRQLFVDNALIESNTLKRVYHYPVKHAANPVLKPETKDEIHAPFDSTKLDMGDVTVFEGREVKLRFTVTEGDLYAFWIAPDSRGASGGYLAGGGPGYTSLKDE